MQITNPLQLQKPLKFCLIKLRVALRTRKTANVNQQFNRVRLQQTEKVFSRPRRVSYRPNLSELFIQNLNPDLLQLTSDVKCRQADRSSKTLGIFRPLTTSDLELKVSFKSEPAAICYEWLPKISHTLDPRRHVINREIIYRYSSL